MNNNCKGAVRTPIYSYIVTNLTKQNNRRRPILFVRILWLAVTSRSVNPGYATDEVRYNEALLYL